VKSNVVFASRDPGRAGILLEALARANFSVSTVRSAKEVTELLSQRACDLLLIGPHLADGDGVGLVKALRSRGANRQIPIVAVLEHVSEAESAAKPLSSPPPGIVSSSGFVRTRSGAVASPSRPAPAPATAPHASLRLDFFQAGADECLTLNQDVAECVARIKAVLRRTAAAPSEEIIRTGPIELNLTSYSLRISGKEVVLTSKELDLLYVFLSSPNRVLSRPYLIERVWGYNYFGSPRTVDVHVRRLREKMGKAASLIHTIPCVGYKLVPSGDGTRR